MRFGNMPRVHSMYICYGSFLPLNINVTSWLLHKNKPDQVHIFMEYTVSCCIHYNDGVMGAMASEIPSLTIVYSIVYSGVNQRKHQSSASLAFVREIHWWPVNFPHKGRVKMKIFPFDDVIIFHHDMLGDCVWYICLPSPGFHLWVEDLGQREKTSLILRPVSLAQTLVSHVWNGPCI